MSKKPVKPAAQVIADAEAEAEDERRLALEEARLAAETKPTPIRFVDCRLFGHDWHGIEADRNPMIGWAIKMQCARCNTTRADIVNRFGEVERRRYEYAESYRDTDHWTRSAWRMQFLRRMQ